MITQYQNTVNVIDGIKKGSQIGASCGKKIMPAPAGAFLGSIIGGIVGGTIKSLTSGKMY